MKKAIHNYYAYIVASQSRVLYVGMTNDLERRIRQHKSGAFAGFTSRYKVNRLVWYERFSNVKYAIAAEKKIKGWTRIKKIALIEEMNPGWFDLTTDDGLVKSTEVLREYAQDDSDCATRGNVKEDE